MFRRPPIAFHIVMFVAYALDHRRVRVAMGSPWLRDLGDRVERVYAHSDRLHRDVDGRMAFKGTTSFPEYWVPERRCRAGIRSHYVRKRVNQG